MITLSIIAYIIFSLTQAERVYWERGKFRDNVWVKNKCFFNTKKSLIYGFLFLPKWVGIDCLIIMIVYGVVRGLIDIFSWIVTYMP